MNTILYRWGLRLHRDNPLHTFITVLDLVFTYTLLYCTARIVQQSFRNHQTDGIGLMWYMSLALNGILIISSVLTMYNAFSSMATPGAYSLGRPNSRLIDSLPKSRQCQFAERAFCNIFRFNFMSIILPLLL